MAGRVTSSSGRDIIAPGNANNIQPPQKNQHPAFTSGPQHIPQAPYPFPRIPIKLPWGAGSTGIAP
jgi:hypothetical protein